MPTIKTNKKIETKIENIPSWDSDIKQESVDKVIKSGVILPEFKPYANAVYEVKFDSEPKFIESEKGNFWSVDINKDGMKYQMKMNNSLKFGIKVLMTRKNLKEFKDILGIPFKICKNSDGMFSIQTL